MRALASLCLLLMSSSVLAESTLPAGCQPIAVKGESVTVQAKKSKLVFINNLAKTDLWITHPVTDPGASAGWTTRLMAGNWSALAVNKGPFILNCIESTPGHEQQVQCEGAIAVCQWKGVKMPAGDQSTFWVGEDMSLPALTAAIGGRGYKLPEAK